MARLSALSSAILCCVALPVAAQNIERMRLTDGDLSCTQIYAEVQQMDMMVKVMGSAPASAPGTAAAAPQAANVATGFSSLFGGAMGQPGAAVPAGMMPNQVGLPPALLADPNVRASIARARAAGYSDAQITAMMQVGAARAGYPVGAALNASGQVPLSAAAGGNNVQIAQNIAAQGQNYAANVAAGQNWQQALANAQGAAAAPPAAAPAPAQNALGGLFGALAARGGAGGNSQAAGLFGALAQQAQGGGNSAPSPAAVAQPAQVAAAPAPSNAAPIVAQAQGRKDHLTNLFLTKGCKMSEIQR